MRRTIVRYKVKPERVADHEALIQAVFAELATTKPGGLRYGAFKQADGVSFVHFSIAEADNNPLEKIAAFKAFTANIKERCDEPPVSTQLEAISTYGL
jgi:hypothetical protein